MAVSRADGNYYKYELSVLQQLPERTSACLYMDVCVLGCTPRHIPRYMSQTSNNNKRLSVIPVMIPVIPVMIPVMPVMIRLQLHLLLLL